VPDAANSGGGVTVSVVEARKERNRQQLTLLVRWCATILAIPALVVALVITLALQNVFFGLIAGLLVFVAVSAFAYRHIRHFGSGLVAGLPEGGLDAEGEARLHNLTDGLCLAHGVTRPTIRVLALESRNAATVVLGEQDREVVLLVTEGLLDALSRIELEGLLAQQLSHIRDGDVALSTFVAAVASMPGAGAVLGRRAGACLDPHLETVADLAGAGMTRYPPGLAAALSRLQDGSGEVAGVPASAAHLWLVDPLPAGGVEPYVPHPPLADRIEVLGEL
jgi:heat shock protein HtpX